MAPSTSEPELSQEGVPLEDQDAAAAAQLDESVDAEVKLREIQGGDGELNDMRQISEAEAEEAGDLIADVVIAPARPADRAQDGLAFENARRDEAVAQGVEVTTQERLWELARQEEAQSQGVDDIGFTTQKALFRQSRAEEARAEKLEQAQHGPVEPLTITPHGIDQLTRDKELAKETPALRKAGAAKVKEERGETVKP